MSSKSEIFEYLINHKYKYANQKELNDPKSYIGVKYQRDMDLLSQMKEQEYQSEYENTLPQLNIKSSISIK